MKNVKVVIGANFGDEGKGMMTDYFASRSAGPCLVVLHNGGAQRGHTVVTPEGIRHVFHHFGSGTLVGADTWCSKEFIVNPVLFREEWEKLSKHITMPKVYIDERCKLTTIFDMLINQVIEFDRGSDKHGSCGIGIYETLYRNQKGVDFINSFEYNPDSMTVGEFVRLNYLGKFNFLDYLRKDYVPRRFNIFGLHNIDKIFINVLKSNEVIQNYINDFQFMIDHCQLRNEEIMADYDTVIFENGQGLLLDQHNMDYFPHLSPSNTGMRNPADILIDYGWSGNVEACYVTRTYMTRHGVGKFLTECPKENINKRMIDMTNVPNPFQDTLRYGYLNGSELNKRCVADAASISGVKFTIIPTIAVTHINEYPCRPICGEKYFSNGMTRKDMTELNNNFIC